MFHRIIGIALVITFASPGALASTCNLDTPVICYGLTSIGRGAFSFVEYQQYGMHKNIIKVLKLGPNGEVMVIYNIYERSLKKIRQLITDVSYNLFPKDPIVKRLIKQRKNRNLRKLI
ncbi:MAG: hypothetical protein NZO16_08155, partial [Deltaproteobacteria bacterium]|nr:hypothetical protein [Deltaproteobacteria bacterium]